MAADTQWPRYQVFVQEGEGQPVQDAGSVHASDAELALLNARDVFARRPACVAMWVVPVKAIFSRTAEELQGWQEPAKTGGETQRFHVFVKDRPAGTQTQIGELMAASPAEAMQLALQKYPHQPSPFVWWVVPESEIVRSAAEEIPSMYAPASEKKFRLSSDFRTVSAMKKIRNKHGS